MHLIASTDIHVRLVRAELTRSTFICSPCPLGVPRTFLLLYTISSTCTRVLYWAVTIYLSVHVTLHSARIFTALGRVIFSPGIRHCRLSAKCTMLYALPCFRPVMKGAELSIYINLYGTCTKYILILRQHRANCKIIKWWGTIHRFLCFNKNTYVFFQALSSCTYTWTVTVEPIVVHRGDKLLVYTWRCSSDRNWHTSVSVRNSDTQTNVGRLSCTARLPTDSFSERCSPVRSIALSSLTNITINTGHMYMNSYI